jgi:hypothetical protein
MSIFVFIDPALSCEDIKSSKFTLVEEQLATQEPAYSVTVASFEDLLPLIEQGKQFWLVISAKLASFHRVELPKLSRKDVFPAIGSILEEQMTQDFGSYHCFYQSTPVATGLSLEVGCIDKSFFEHLVFQFEANGIQISGVAMDLHALNDNEVLLLSSEDAIARVPDFLGWVPKSLLRAKLMPTLGLSRVLCAKKLDFAPLNAEIIEENFYLWCVKRFNEKGIFDILMPEKPFDFLEKIPKAKAELYTKRGVAALFLGSIIFFLSLFFSNIYYHRQNKQIITSSAAVPSEELAEKLVIYNRQQTERNRFWRVFVGLQKSYNTDIKIVSFNYNQGVIHLALNAPSLASFQAFKKNLAVNRIRLQESGVAVTGTSVKANLDLRSL